MATDRRPIADREDYWLTNQVGQIVGAGVNNSSSPSNFATYSTDASGNVTGALSSSATLGFSGFIPPTNDWAGIMSARAACLKAGGGVVQLLPVVYNLGSNYIPITSGVSYVGVMSQFGFNNSIWTDYGNAKMSGGTVIQGTNNYCFWDGATALAGVVAQIAAQNATFTAGSSSIQVTNSALFTNGARAYVTSTANGFYAGIPYFLQVIDSTHISLALPDGINTTAATFASITATGTGTINGGVSQGLMNELNTGFQISNIAFNNVNTAIKIGATNTCGIAYSQLTNIFVNGNINYRCLDITNFAHIEVNNIYTWGGDGQWWASDYPYTTLQWGNCNFSNIFHTSDSQSGANMTSRNIIFTALNGSYLNQISVWKVQCNNYNSDVEITTTVAATASSANITYTSGSPLASFLVDMPLFITTINNPNGFLTNTTYFVVSNNGTNLQISLTKGGAAQSSNSTSPFVINSWGYANIEVVGLGTGQVPNFDLNSVDIEGPSTVGILLQSCYGSVAIREVANASNFVSVCGRSILTIGGGLLLDSSSTQLTTDFQGSSSVTVRGYLSHSVGLYSAPGTGVFRSGYFGANDGCIVGSFHETLTQTTPGLIGAYSSGSSNAWLKSMLPVGMLMNTNDTVTAQAPTGGGWWVYNGAGICTITLPTITNTNSSQTYIGMPFYFSNASTSVLTVATNGTQTFNNIAAKTTATVAANGGILKCTAAITAGGTMYWIAELVAPF